MPTVAVLTDSTVGLPETILNNLKIETVAYYIHGVRKSCGILSPYSAKNLCNG